LLHLVGINSFEGMKTHGLTNPKFTTTSFRNNTVILDTGKNVWKVFSLKEIQLPDGEQNNSE